MSGSAAYNAAVRSVVESRAVKPAVQRGPITRVQPAGASFIVTVDLGYPLTVKPDGLSGPFLGELRAAAAGAGVESLVGRKVEVTFSAGRQAAIAYTVGV